MTSTVEKALKLILKEGTPKEVIANYRILLRKLNKGLGQHNGRSQSEQAKTCPNRCTISNSYSFTSGLND